VDLQEKFRKDFVWKKRIFTWPSGFRWTSICEPYGRKNMFFYGKKKWKSSGKKNEYFGVPSQVRGKKKWIFRAWEKKKWIFRAWEKKNEYFEIFIFFPHRTTWIFHESCLNFTWIYRKNFGKNLFWEEKKL